MKSFIFILIMVFLYTLTAYAGGLSYSEKSKLKKAGYSSSEIRKADQDAEYKYKGSSGTKYKYDLSKPSDNLKYGFDAGAQMKDDLYMPIKPGVTLDRSLNQYGGGVKP